MKTFKKFVADMLPVMAGILIALMLNNVQEERRNAQFVEKSLSAMKNEHAENVAEIESALLFHKTFRDSLASQIEDPQKNVLSILSRSGGFRAATVSSTSWDKLLGSKLDLVDYELISILTKIDENKDKLDEIMGRISEFGERGMLVSTDQTTKMLFMLTLTDLISWEEKSLEHYERFDAYMENAYGASS